MTFSVRSLYLYLVSFIGLIVVVFGTIRIVNLGLKTFVFPQSDRYDYAQPKMPEETEQTFIERQQMSEKINTQQRQREFIEAISMLIVGLPLYLYHWKKIEKDNLKNKK